MSGSGMTTPMLATHSNRRFSCKGIFRVFPDVFFGALFGSHDGSDGDGSMCRSYILPADKNIVTSSRVKCGVIFVSSGDVATFQSRNAQSYG